MKECPVCHAKIEENARFCIHCMTGFEEKCAIPPLSRNLKGIPIIFTALSLVLVSAAVGVAFLAKEGPENLPSGDGNRGVDGNRSSGTVSQPLTPHPFSDPTTEDSISPTEVFSSVDGEKFSGGTLSNLSGSDDIQKDTNTQTDTPITQIPRPTNTQTDSSTGPLQSTNTQTARPSAGDSQNTATSSDTPAPEADIAYTFDEKTGTLTLSGKGAMPDYSQNIGAPWKKYEYSIKKVIISEGITSVGEFAFSNFAYLTELILPKGLSSINYGAFMGCRSLTECVFPDSLKTIESFAFNGCNFIYLHIPAGVMSIRDYAFSQYRFTSGFETITVAPENTFYHASGNCLIETKTKTMILGCKNSVIPADGSVTSIFTYAFQHCSGLTEITVPDTVTYLDNQVFYDCSDLTEVILPKNLKKIEYATFYGCKKLARITLPRGIVSIGESAFFGCESLTEITIPDSVIAIEKDAFGNCYNLKTVYNDSALPITKGSMKHGYVGYYAEHIYN